MAHTQPFVGNVVICSHVKDDCDFWPLLRGSCRQRLLSCGFFNVLLNHLNGQLASCERIINISCQGIKTVLCPFLPSLWPLLEVPLGGLDTTQCCHLLVIMWYWSKRAMCAVPWIDSGWQSSKCSCGNEGSGNRCVWLDKAGLVFCSDFLVA